MRAGSRRTQRVKLTNDVDKEGFHGAFNETDGVYGPRPKPKRSLVSHPSPSRGPGHAIVAVSIFAGKYWPEVEAVEDGCISAVFVMAIGGFVRECLLYIKKTSISYKTFNLTRTLFSTFQTAHTNRTFSTSGVKRGVTFR